MDGESPKEYITLRPESNWVLWSLPNGAVKEYKNHFFKVRVVLDEPGSLVMVNTWDFTFTDGLSELVKTDWFRTITGASDEDYENVFPVYGSARSCDGRRNEANVDLRGLPLRVSTENLLIVSGAQEHMQWMEPRMRPEMTPETVAEMWARSRLSSITEDQKQYNVAVGGWCSGGQWGFWSGGGYCIERGSESFCMSLDYTAHLVEECDDGNDVDNDGCSATCEVEAGWRCPRASAEDPHTEPCVCACGEGRCEGGGGDGGGEGGESHCLTPSTSTTLPVVAALVGAGATIYLSNGTFLNHHCGLVIGAPNVSIVGQVPSRSPLALSDTCWLASGVPPMTCSTC